MKATLLPCRFSWLWSGMPKVPWNNNSPLYLKRVEWFWFFALVICILLDILWWIYQNILFWAGTIRHRPSANQIVRCFKIKKLYEVSSWFFASIEATKNIILFWVMLENTLGQSVCRIFYFWLVWLVNLNTGGSLLHCTCFIRILFMRIIRLKKTLKIKNL